MCVVQQAACADNPVHMRYHIATPILRYYVQNASRNNLLYFLVVWFIATAVLPPNRRISYATFTAIHPDLPPFLQKAILHYVDVLETEWLERELGILKE